MSINSTLIDIALVQKGKGWGSKGGRILKGFICIAIDVIGGKLLSDISIHFKIHSYPQDVVNIFYIWQSKLRCPC